MRYSTFIIEGIAHHDYYNSKKYARQKIEAQRQIQEVITKLELVADWMDVEEAEKARQRQIQLQKEREERARRQKELEQKKLEEIQRKLDAYTNNFSKPSSPSASNDDNVEESALAKLQRLGQPQQPPPAPKRVSFQTPGAEDGSKPEPDGHMFRIGDGGSLPPPLLPPSSSDSSDTGSSILTPMAPPGPDEGDNGPPSYEQILQTSKISSSYFGPGLEDIKHSLTDQDQSSVPPTASLPSYDQIAKKTKKKRPKKIPIRKLIAESIHLYSKYQQKGKIQVSALGTYQGRYSSSTNGCTVISALVAARHLQTHGGVTNDQINAVIDNDCGPLLQEIRSKLQLSPSSLIIPSDVHDHLVDKKILHQYKFVDATGGNIVDPDHIDNLLNLLEGDEESKTRHLKSAATLFFREHVVSIVKFPTSPTEAVYDLVDSLPTVQKMGSSRGSRTRCQDIDTLRVLLQAYACKKFSDSNCTYIERNEWDDMMADFDPRVFQAFVWSDVGPKQAKTVDT
jgi:hypothetical protein